MMEVNVVPSVVLHFHGFRSSLLSTLADAARRLALLMAQRSLQASLLALAMFYFQLLVVAALRRLALAPIVYAAFLACEALAVKYAKKESAFLLCRGKRLDETPRRDAAVPTLPRLLLPASIAVLPEPEPAAQRKIVGGDLTQIAPKLTATPPPLLATPQPPRQLSAVRRRVAAQLRAPFPGVNTVPQERRRRADMSLHTASIRVGKAFLDPTVDEAIAHGDKKRKQVDIYMVRVDCSKPDDKHMNPVVMWDFTATFEEFRKLEKDLRAEVKAKRLRFVEVPHLSSGAILFVQPELTQDVLAKRRTRLQAFVEALRSDRALADSDAMRKFCQAY